ncbi:MAG: aspartyl protease family protein [Sediminicola sp.]|tara:strand:+ start:92891 stop:94240 length:1350 start_codon:yes stop_codon:yes gene_type:complete
MARFFKHIPILLLFFPVFSLSQGFGLDKGAKFQKVPFQLVNNLIVLPVEVNGAQLSFILDSGVGTPILFNLSGQDSVQINNVREVTLRGLGEGAPIKALGSTNNLLRIGRAKNPGQSLYVIMDKDLNFSPSLGVTIHGIMGYELFRDFVVDINYATKVIKLYDPQHYSKKYMRRSEILPLEIENRRAFVDGEVLLNGKSPISVRLLVDTGSSDAIWLFPNAAKGLEVPKKNYDDFLGKGLNGNIFGKRTMVENFRWGSHSLKDPKAAFPDMQSFDSVRIKRSPERNGSVGGDILKRFNIVFNYSKNEMAITKNRHFNDPFQYNLSGVELIHAGTRLIADRLTDQKPSLDEAEGKSFGNVQLLMDGGTRLSLVPEIVVSSIRAGSPAAEAGLMEGDLILAINGKSVHRYKLQEVLEMINEGEGKRIKVVIERANKDLLFSFVLKELFKPH